MGPDRPESHGRRAREQTADSPGGNENARAVRDKLYADEREVSRFEDQQTRR